MDFWKALKMAVGAVDTETDGFWTFSREIFAFAVDAMVDLTNELQGAALISL